MGTTQSLAKLEELAEEFEAAGGAERVREALESERMRILAGQGGSSSRCAIRLLSTVALTHLTEPPYWITRVQFACLGMQQQGMSERGKC